MKKHDIEYIHPSDLKMWAKYSYPKFSDAWSEYQKVISSGREADIIWHIDGTIEIVTRPLDPSNQKLNTKMLRFSPTRTPQQKDLDTKTLCT